MLKNNYSPLDKIVLAFDQGLRTVFGKPASLMRETPAQVIADFDLTLTEKRHVAGLMRINHAGEVCAQALYQGQALTTRDEALRQHMQESAIEENDHLIWCQLRLAELDSHTSYLNLLWYLASLSLGTLAGMIGDKWSLGFVAETEAQVVKHLQEHLQKLPQQDKKSQAILQQMCLDEAHHKNKAVAAGAADLPAPIKFLMGITSKIMVKTAYWL